MSTAQSLGAAAKAALLALLGCCLCISGCGSPSRANIVLRKENQTLREENDKLTKQHQADADRIAAMERRNGSTPILSQATVDEVFTTHKVELGRLTGAADFDVNHPGEDGIKVYLMPEDETGEVIKSTGQVVIELFDLGEAGGKLLGHWTFSAEQAKPLWRSLGPLKAFVFECPWEKRPEHNRLTLHVNFQDALTGRTFTLSHDIALQ